jgi:hypothetical protein
MSAKNIQRVGIYSEKSLQFHFFQINLNNKYTQSKSYLLTDIVSLKKCPYCYL